MEFLDETPEVEPIDGPVRPGAIRIILADSQAIYRVGIRKIFALEDDLRVVAQADSLDNLKAAIERYPTDVVLLEGGLLVGNHNNAIPDLLKIAPDVKLIVQAISADENQTVELYRAACAASSRAPSRPICWSAACAESPPARPGSTINR